MLQEERDRYLNAKIDATVTVREAGGVQFVGFLLSKVNGMNGMDPRVVEINALSQGYPGRNLTDDNKIEWLKRLEALGVVL
jgi:hypothetical protein